MKCARPRSMAIWQWRLANGKDPRASAALLSMPEHLADFREAPGYPSFGISAGDAYRRMEIQLSALERAIQQGEARSTPT